MNQSGPEPDPRIREARSALEAERAASTTEIEAWEAFGRRLGKIARSQPSPRPVSGQGGQTTLGRRKSVSGDGRVQKAVRTAFEETVFSTDVVDEHLESDPYALMRAELSAEMAATVYESPPPPPTFVSGLRDAVEGVLANRHRVIEVVDEEQAAIQDRWSSLRPIREELDSYQAVYPDVSATGLFAYHDRLGELREQCVSIAIERQASLHSSTTVALDTMTVVEYLYEECSATFPVLSVVTSIVREIDGLRADLRRDIATLEDDPRSRPP